MTGTLIPPRIRHALTIIGSLTLGAPAAALAQCDLDAKFGGNASQTFLTGQPAGLSVRFTNLATTGDCAANQVRLRLTGGSLVTAPMAFQALPALPPKGVVVLTFQVTVPLPGTHVFEVEYATPHQDVDNGNHHPTRTVTFSAPAVTLALPDLMVTSVGPVDGLRVGNCNTVNVTVRNTGSALQTATQLTLLVYRSSAGQHPGRQARDSCGRVRGRRVADDSGHRGHGAERRRLATRGDGRRHHRGDRDERGQQHPGREDRRRVAAVQALSGAHAGGAARTTGVTPASSPDRCRRS